MPHDLKTQRELSERIKRLSGFVVTEKEPLLKVAVGAVAYSIAMLGWHQGFSLVGGNDEYHAMLEQLSREIAEQVEVVEHWAIELGTRSRSDVVN